ncbi:formiminoglutamase [Gelidibacter sediminis]|uniref:Formiminoglutamase n=1 Tax=Gelidibacter sediminis TaxID=1608710 RepID=A0A4R7PY63_9FLAO|nr:formimidoylglutamase [Gelidibacter sediminis]TDU39924.1 formiminoglutamase [Gelidibacter sediminis]
MNKLVLFNIDDLNRFLKKRPHESKFGEHIKLISNTTNIYESLTTLDVNYVIFGIPEDIGVFANYGNRGTAKAWEATLKVLLNIQSNVHTKANKVLVLGHLDFSKEMDKINHLDNSDKNIAKARKLTEKIDRHVTELVHTIVSAGKKPIIIGGGHNNAYGNIKGSALAFKKPINVVNFDAHSDFRKEEGRHSGNGFSYAYAEGFLKNYFIFGLHENYTSNLIFKTLDKFKALKYNTFEALTIRKDKKFKAELTRAEKHVAEKPFGVEVDCDAIKYIPSSAITPSGFSVKKARAFVTFFGNQKNAAYLHICEAAPTADTEVIVGKLITYLITDFIRANQSIYENR